MFCKQCGKEISNQAVVCMHCGTPTQDTSKARPSHTGLRMLLPIDRSGYAVAAGYLGLFSVLLVFGPLALVFGILGVVDIKKHQDKHGMGRSVFGIIMGVLGSLGLIGMIIASFT